MISSGTPYHPNILSDTEECSRSPIEASPENTLPSLSREHFRPLFRFSTPWYSSCDKYMTESLFPSKDGEKKCEMYESSVESYIKTSDTSTSSIVLNENVDHMQDKTINQAAVEELNSSAFNDNRSAISFNDTIANNMELLDSKDKFGIDSNSYGSCSICPEEKDEIFESSWLPTEDISKSHSSIGEIYDDMLAIINMIRGKVAELKLEFRQILEALKKQVN